MARTSITEIIEHDQLVLMMARYFKQLGYKDIKADIPEWTQPSGIYWSNNPGQVYIPDLTCFDSNGVFIILEAETCNSLNDLHTKEQFKIFRAHANNNNGRFEVIVPRICSGDDARSLITKIATSWDLKIDNVWTPGT